MDADKLARLQKNVRIGGKGTPRRKVKKTQKAEGGDDKKLQGALAKLNAQTIPQIEELNMFQEDGKVLHFARPQVQAAASANTFAVHGNGQEKDLAELFPGILSQLGPESLDQLRRIAESYQQQEAAGSKEAEDDEIPELVEGETFDKEID